jgi:hypothetical protein
MAPVARVWGDDKAQGRRELMPASEMKAASAAGRRIVGETEMTPLHDSLLTGYAVEGSTKTLVLHTHPHRGGGGAFDVRFTGVVAYRFEGLSPEHRF